MTVTQQLLTIAVVALGTMLTRFLPFLLFPAGRPTPKYIHYLGTVLPPAVFGLLVIYCLRNVSVLTGSHRLPEGIAIAAVIALLDLLPVIGTGSVLIPWAVLALLGGESGLGWGLIVLYLVITVARNFLEPRIVGSSIGLPPLLSLVCVYAGLRLFGVLGAVLMPCAALTVLFFLKSNRASPPAEKPE